MTLKKRVIEGLLRKLTRAGNMDKEELQGIVEGLHVNFNLLYNVATHDEKTGLHNFAFFKEIFAIELSQAERGKKFSLVIGDIDFFKKINDTLGHDFADMLLKRVSTVLVNGLRPYDNLARFGGEEFLIILSNTSAESAKEVTERIRQLILKDDILTKYGVTLSFGVSSYKKGDNFDTLLGRADKALYQAKNTGRNKVCWLDDKKKIKCK